MKKLTLGLRSSGGRTNKGRESLFHRGGGHKRRYRYIDFSYEPRLMKDNSLNIKNTGLGLLEDWDGKFDGIVRRVEYDPNRTAHIALVCDGNNGLTYILATEGLNTGSIVFGKESKKYSIGRRLLIRDCTLGTIIHNFEMFKSSGGKIARAAGTSGQILKAYNKDYVVIKMPSGECRLVSKDCYCTLGTTSNSNWEYIDKRKAGNMRWIGRRPIVRGVAMNPVAHPHGGGEGKSSGGRCSVSPWGRLTKGKKTRLRKNKMVIKGRNRGANDR